MDEESQTINRLKTELNTLRKEVEKWRTLAETKSGEADGSPILSPRITIQVQNDGSISDISPECESILGLTPGEILDRPLGDIIVDEPIPFDTEKAVPVELSVRHKNGKEFRLAFTLNPLLSDRQIIGMVFTGYDPILIKSLPNTSLKDVQAALEESESKYSALLESIQDGFFIIERNHLQFVNQAFSDMVGYTLEELKDTGFEDTVAPEDLDMVTTRYFSRQAGDPVPNQYEFRMLHKDGSRISVNMKVGLAHFQGRTVSIGTTKNITERIQAEKALRESVEKYRLLVENQLDLVVKVDLEGRLVFVSPSYCDTFGKTEEELLGQPFLEPVHPDDREAAKGAWNALYSPPHTAFMEQRAFTRNGWCWLAWANTAVFNEMGQIVEFIGVGRDITSRKRAEEALKESEGRYRAFLDQLPDPTVAYNMDGSTIYINKAFEATFGWTAGELLGRPIDYAPEMVQEDMREAVKRMLDGDHVETMETKRSTKDGRILDILLSSSPFHDARGKQIGILMILRDISNQKRIEEALAHSETTLGSILRNIPDIIYRLDENGNITFINEAVLRYGHHPHELIGKNIFLLVHPEDADAAKYRINERRTASRSTVGLEVRLLSDNHFGSVGGQSYRIFSITAEGLYGSEHPNYDSFLGTQGIARDITDRKQLENQLRQAQKMEAVGTLAGGIAHDFNNFLQAISGYVQLLLLRKDIGENNRDYLIEIDETVDRASELVHRLLAFSRKMEPELQPVNLNHEVTQAVRMLERTIPRMIEIETSLVEDLLPVLGDANQLEQILMNLGTNARDAMPDGGKLTIATANTILDDEFCRTHLGSKPGEYACLSISDNGNGMSREIMEHIYEPFFTTKKTGQGTGLGLAMVYGIVKTHNGYISCESGLGEGSRFDIYLPVLKDDTAIEISPTTECTEIRGGSETILLVDDEDAILNIGGEILEEYGYRVITATNGETAIETYQRDMKGIDLILLDLSMPGMGGIKALKELLSLDPQAKIIISSGYSGQRQAKGAMSSGAAGFLGKPYRLVEMLRIIREVLDAKQTLIIPR